VVMGMRESRQLSAQELVSRLEGPHARTISGRVAGMAEFGDTEAARVTLNDVTVTSGSSVFHLPGRVQLTIEAKAMAGNGDMPAVGEQITFPGQILRPVALQNFFGYNRLEALRHDGIYATAVPMALDGIVRRDDVSFSPRSPIDRALTGFRKRISVNLQQCMWEREGRLMIAMLFNDMRSLTDIERQVFRDSATFHLFAVSGMHVAILGLALNLVFRAMRLGLRASWILVAIVLVIYLWIIGFVPSATRSYLMLVAFTSAYMLGREVDSLSSLVFAVAAVIAYDPSAPWQAGFVLSVMGVAAIVMFVPLFKLWIFGTAPRPPRGFRGTAIDTVTEALLTTVAVSIVMFPIQVYYFGFWNFMSPVANLLQAGLSSAVLSAGVIAAVVGTVSDGAAQVVGESASCIMWIVYQVSRWAADSSWAMFYFRQMPVWITFISYVLLFGGYYLVHHDTPEFRLKSRARFITHSCCGLGLLLGFQLWANWHPKELEIWSFDVGQGDATLIRFPDGKTMLVDAGRDQPDMGRLVVVPQLRGLGIARLDYLVATHDDSDHTGGIASVIRGVGVNNLLVPRDMEEKSVSTRAMLAAARKRFCVVREVSAGQIANAGDCRVEVLNPPNAAGPDTPDNDRSVVLKITYRNFTALLMADASTAVESRLIN
jgi:competence protein ComEC